MLAILTKKNRLATVVATAILLLGVYFVYNLFYLNKVWPNTYFSQIKLGGKNRDQVRDSLSLKLDRLENEPLILSIEGREIPIRKSDLGIKFDRTAIIETILTRGRSGNLGQDLAARISAPFRPTRIRPVYKIEFAILVKTLDEKLGQFEKPSQDATIDFVNGKATIVDEADGKLVDKSSLVQNLKSELDLGSDLPIKVLLVEQKPKVYREHAKRALEKAESLSKQKIILKFGFDSWTLAQDDILDLLKFYPEGQEAGFATQMLWVEPIKITWMHFLDSPPLNLNVSLDQDNLDDFIALIAKTIDRKMVDATLKFENGKVSQFTPAQDGQKLDRTKTRDLIASYVSIDKVETEPVVTIDLPVNVSRARIASDEINSLGIKELLARGVSYFSGSIANRIHNLALGASRVSGTLVKPQEVFSFNQTVGEVSAATGYRQAYVISAGRTVLDDGGGICQVSTTVFRAALAAGLPIVSRTAHAYRVGYYEQSGFGPGLDATVWAPAVDLQFKNNTGYHLLIQATADFSASKLQVDIYGTDDGRRVDMTEPTVSNQKPPLPDKYQDDPTLPKGVVKQVDFAAWGATSVFTRKVYKGRELISDDVFRSNFRPWQAIYLVGTGT